MIWACWLKFIHSFSNCARDGSWFLHKGEHLITRIYVKNINLNIWRRPSLSWATWVPVQPERYSFHPQRRSLFLQHTEATWKPQLIRMQKISDCEVLNPIGQICNETPMKRGQEDYKSQKTRLPAAKTGQGSRTKKSQQYGCLNKTCIMTTPFDMPV